jgi:hypothetical protein
MNAEYIELRLPMANWLEAHAEFRGLTLKELVAHILLSYQEEWEDSENGEDENFDEETGDEEEGDASK